MTLREIVHAHIPLLNHGHTVRDAVDRMDVYQFPALVVVDEHMTPTHVVTEGDLCRAVRSRGDVVSLSAEPVIIHATPDPTTAPAAMEVSEALHLMLSRGITVLPVVEAERTLGMVLRVDLMQAMLMDVVPA